MPRFQIDLDKMLSTYAQGCWNPMRPNVHNSSCERIRWRLLDFVREEQENSTARVFSFQHVQLTSPILDIERIVDEYIAEMAPLKSVSSESEGNTPQNAETKNFEESKEHPSSSAVSSPEVPLQPIKKEINRHSSPEIKRKKLKGRVLLPVVGALSAHAGENYKP